MIQNPPNSITVDDTHVIPHAATQKIQLALTVWATQRRVGESTNRLSQKSQHFELEVDPRRPENVSRAPKSCELSFLQIRPLFGTSQYLRSSDASTVLPHIRQAMSPMYKSSLASFVRLFQACLSEEKDQPGVPPPRSRRGSSAPDAASASVVGDRLARLTPALQVRIQIAGPC